MEKNEETFWFITPVIGSIVTMLSYHNIPVDILYGFKVVFSLLMGIIGALLGEIVRQEVKKKYDKKKQLIWLESIIVDGTIVMSEITEKVAETLGVVLIN